jgi:pyruvate dehydrogenase E2 component (dihydrolipoamide acetyltransferase)
MAETVTMPKLGFDMAEGTLVRWVKAEGEAVGRGEVLAEIETDKATVEVESSFEGIMARHLVEQGSIVPVGTSIAVIAAPGEAVGTEEPQPARTEVPPAAAKAAKPAPADQPKPQASPVAETAGKVRASPLARRMAVDFNVDLGMVSGSGPGGRVVRKDVEAFLAERRPAAATPVEAPAVPVVSPVLSTAAVVTPAVNDQVVPVNKLRAAIGRRMVEAKQQAPHFYVTHDYDMAAVMKLRKEINLLLPDEQKLSVNDFIIKGVGLALRQFPNINASLQGNQVLRHGRVSVGVAVAIEGGLLTVVCKDADQKPISAIAREIKEMVARARLGKVRPEDIEGSTFSISNLGMFDVEHFIAIINPPEAAILAVGSVKDVPVVVEGELRAGTRMKATLSADHRVTDGAEAAQFLQALAKFLEEPLRMLI